KSSQVFFSKDGDKLTLRAPVNRNSVDVRFEIKLPQELRAVKLTTVNGGIKLKNLKAKISAQTVNGPIDLTDVAGLSSAKSTNGRISAVLNDEPDNKIPITLESVNGAIDLQIKYDINAELNAETVSGSMTVDDTFGVPVERQMVGSKA